jgi:rhodanese-related sulfurtransferase
MQRPPTVPTVTVEEAHRRLEAGGPDGPLLVDVRDPDEFAQARMPGAVLVPLPEFAARCGDLPMDRSLLLTCASGARSGAAAAHLLALGWTDVANVEGGIIAWYRAGLPIRSGPLEPGEGGLPG